MMPAMNPVPSLQGLNKDSIQMRPSYPQQQRQQLGGNPTLLNQQQSIMPPPVNAKEQMMNRAIQIQQQAKLQEQRVSESD